MRNIALAAAAFARSRPAAGRRRAGAERIAPDEQGGHVGQGRSAARPRCRRRCWRRRAAAQPGFTPAEAESETRDGRRYFDIGGKLADGSEVEFDIMEEGGRWRVVETQRDIALRRRARSRCASAARALPGRRG